MHTRATLGVTRRDVLIGTMAIASGTLGGSKYVSARDSRPTLLLTHPEYALHDPGPYNVERPSRMQAIDRALSGDAFRDLRRNQPNWRDDVEEQILQVHTKVQFETLKALGNDKAHLPHAIDGDTVLSTHTWNAAILAVCAGLDAVDAVFDNGGGIKNVFCQVRPPGHHAEASRAMGFCFFSNIAIAACYARRRYGAERVAVIDFDVHHGNGTQKAFWSDKDMFYGSTHQMPLFPGTGAISETGVGNIHNAPLRARDDGAVFRQAMKERVLPALDRFRPDLVLVSAGFDAHEGDPIAQLRLHEDDYVWITEQAMHIAERHCSGRVVSMLEGGYWLEALARSTAAHVSTLMGA